MALPVIFASLTSPTMSQLDQNFNALGALTPIPCTVSGTNALTLTPLTNAPTVVAYQNYMQFTAIAGATSTGLITAQIGSLASLNVYADSSSGVSQATTGQIVQNTAFTLMYDSTLNSGSGGFHLLSAVAVGSFLPLVGGTLTGKLTGTTIAITGPLTAASATLTGLLSAGTVAATGLVSGATVTGTTLVSGASLSMSGNGAIGGTLAVTGNTTLGALNIAGGSLAKRMLSASVSLAYGALNPSTGSDQTIALVGVKAGDSLMAGVPSAPTAGIAFFPYVSANDTVIMRAFNFSAATLTPPSGAYQITAIGFT